MKLPIASSVTGVKTKTGHALEPAPVVVVRVTPVIPATTAGAVTAADAVVSPEVAKVKEPLEEAARVKPDKVTVTVDVAENSVPVRVNLMAVVVELLASAVVRIDPETLVWPETQVAVPVK